MKTSLCNDSHNSNFDRNFTIFQQYPQPHVTRYTSKLNESFSIENMQPTLSRVIIGFANQFSENRVCYADFQTWSISWPLANLAPRLSQKFRRDFQFRNRNYFATNILGFQKCWFISERTRTTSVLGSGWWERNIECKQKTPFHSFEISLNVARQLTRWLTKSAWFPRLIPQETMSMPHFGMQHDHCRNKSSNLFKKCLFFIH